MCRIFGFRSVIQSGVHTSLLNADNALESQSVRHPDGWGVAYYLEDSPHIIRSKDAAMDDRLFKKVSGIVSSQTVLAHIRKATQGENSILNTHPFQHGHWTFIHNGHVKNFDQVKPQIMDGISSNLKRFILGDTDSELLFYFLLSEVEANLTLDLEDVYHQAFVETVKNGVRKFLDIIGPCNFDEGEIRKDHNYITFVLTDGHFMLAHQGGQPLNYSTFKKSCSEKDTCPAYSKICEHPPTDGKVNHMIFSSEPISGENIWKPMKNHEVVSVDSDMNIYFCSV